MTKAIPAGSQSATAVMAAQVEPLTFTSDKVISDAELKLTQLEIEAGIALAVTVTKSQTIDSGINKVAKATGWGYEKCNEFVDAIWEFYKVGKA